MSIAYGGIIAFLFRGVNLLVALATILLTSRELSEGDYGLFVLSLSVIGLVNAATGGITAATAYQISNRRREPALVALNSGSLAAALGMLAILAGVVATAAFRGEVSQVGVAVGVSAAAIISNSVLAGVFLGRESLVRYNLALVTPPILSLVAIGATFVAFDHRSPEAALAAYAAGQCAALVAMLVLGRSLLRGGASFDGSLTSAVLRFMALAGISSGISYLNYRADLFVVTHFEGKEGAATYSLAVYLAESVWQVSGSLALATYARVGSLSRDEAAQLTTRVMRHTVVLLGAACLALFAAADLLETVIAGDKYQGMASALRFLIPGVLMYSLAQSFSGFYTYQRGLPWVAAVVAGTGLVLDMVLAFILVPRMGINGAALASSLAYSGAILGGLAVFVRKERLRPSQVFRFGRAELDDYASLVGRLRGLVSR
ncbi:MAG: hypothetical protein C0506_11330 [Anaerolinea sp.]|nr:hypothetical protein [Anaerolinea sp.]